MTNLLILQDLIKAFEAVTKSYNISKKDAEKYIRIIESTEAAVIEYDKQFTKELSKAAKYPEKVKSLTLYRHRRLNNGN
jgi:hypothetical protein